MTIKSTYLEKIIPPFAYVSLAQNVVSSTETAGSYKG